MKPKTNAKAEQKRKRAAPLPVPKPWMRVSDMAVAGSHRRPRKSDIPLAFTLPAFPPGVVPKDAPTMAQDSDIGAANAWAAQAVYNGAFIEGTTFLGYTYLSELAQRPEYRRISEVLATEATRKWIKLASKGDSDKTDQIKQLTEEMERLDVQGAFRRMIELDGFFGRAHLYLDLGTTEDREELQTPIGDGRNAFTKAKVTKGSLKRLQPVEPVWCYPAEYNSNDPLRPDWYKPQMWFCQGKKIHVSRLLPFVGREVPDLLKPAYAFGGLSLSQMAKPYVDNWLRTRQAVADLVWSFSVSGIKTDLSTTLSGDGDQLFRRLEVFNNLRNNRGVMALQNGADGEDEEFFNVSTPLSSLDSLQAQAQEHMCSVTGTPVVKLLGIQPAGLNASSQGELESWYDWVEAFQAKFISEKLTRVLDFVMISLWGERDPDITYTYESLRSDDPVASATERKILAETDATLIEAGTIAPEESRQRIANDPESGYSGIDVNAVPEPIGGEEDAMGAEPNALAEHRDATEKPAEQAAA